MSPLVIGVCVVLFVLLCLACEKTRPLAAAIVTLALLCAVAKATGFMGLL